MAITTKFINSKSIILKKALSRLAHTYKRPFRGDGRFTGQILVGETPKQATVELYHVATNTKVVSVESDVSGNFNIPGIKEREVYDLIAVDPNGEWEKKVSSNRQPYYEPKLNPSSFHGEYLDVEVTINPV